MEMDIIKNLAKKRHIESITYHGTCTGFTEDNALKMTLCLREELIVIKEILMYRVNIDNPDIAVYGGSIDYNREPGETWFDMVQRTTEEAIKYIRKYGKCAETIVFDFFVQEK